jgi:NAD(P)-dependent dehydrogenase (short-subunit alcohol dehydrogenase family)
MDLELGGKGFIITGGTNGLGLALARALVREGAKVALCGRDPERVARAQHEFGERALVERRDVTVADELDAFARAARTFLPGIHGLVNNAGRSAASPVASSTDAQWRDDFDLKVMAAVRLSRILLDDLAATGGSILNVLAIMGRTMPGGSTPTAASRAAGLAFTKALSHEVGPRGIRVNAVLIGLIASGQWEARANAMGRPVSELYEGLAATAPIALGRVGRADEFADVASFLLSNRASYLTGVALNIDGGLSTVA